MSDVVVFHHVQGLTPGVHRFADDLRQRGHRVVVPDPEAARTLVETTDKADLFLYPGDQHLIADEGLPSYDPAAATLLKERALEFLDGCSAGRRHSAARFGGPLTANASTPPPAGPDVDHYRR